jgi:DNA-binding response OmpR family regulator
VRVLLVEDDEPLARAVHDGLAARGLAVDVVGSASAARSMLALEPYEVVLLDLGLPDQDGLSMLRELRGRGASVPVLILTARGAVDDRVTGLDAGADDYLLKPFAVPELVARIHALARRSGPVIPAVMRVADLELDPGRHRATRRGMTLALTAKEFAILECLMRHAGQLVTRTMLLEQCWDASYEGLSNLVDVHVSRVRRKLDGAGGPPLLHTIRGAGFVLDEQPR